MASKTLNSKCIKCSKGFLNTKQKTVQCTLCSNHLHLKCIDLNKNAYQSFSGDKDFICQYCSHYPCITCQKHVYDKQDGFFCDGCNLWTHRWCTRVSKLEYKCLTEKSVETWYCKNCKKSVFPFFDLNDLKLVKLLCTKKKLTIKPTQSQQTDANVTIRNKMCNVCKKANNKIDKSFVCKTCHTPIHKKCLGLRLSEIHDIKNSKTETYWDCQTCMSDKFPFTAVENKVIVQNTFNSSFSCKCQTSSKYEIGRPEFVFKYRINDNDHEKTYGNIIDNNNAILDNFVLQPNFKYYDNHEFHKLSKHLHQTNDFSLFHTNICSLNANFENLETLISNLEFSFSVIAVSETWTPIGKSEAKPRKLEGYQNYHGNRG